jgi:hypothetical protein
MVVSKNISSEQPPCSPLCHVPPLSLTDLLSVKVDFDEAKLSASWREALEFERALMPDSLSALIVANMIHLMLSIVAFSSSSFKTSKFLSRLHMVILLVDISRPCTIAIDR